MNSAQVTAFQPGVCVKNSKSCVLPMLCIITPFSRIRNITLKDKPLFGFNSLKPLCAGGKGMMENNDENSPWKSLSNAMEKFKGQSIEEVLRKQLQKGEYLDNGRSGVKPPGGGEGGGGGGSPNGTGGSQDENDDTLTLSN